MVAEESRKLRQEAGEVMKAAKRRAVELQGRADELDAISDARKLNGRTLESAERLASRLRQLTNGTVILFTKNWAPRGTGYTYAAVKDGTGLWNTTGPRSPKKYDDGEFARWLAGVAVGSGQPVQSIRAALAGFYVWSPGLPTAPDMSGQWRGEAVYDDRA